MARSIETIDAIVTDLQMRVNQLDGSGLSDASQSTAAQLLAEINGLRTTLNQAVLGMEADRQAQQDQIDALKTQLQAHLGVTS